VLILDKTYSEETGEKTIIVPTANANILLGIDNPRIINECDLCSGRFLLTRKMV